MGKLTSRKSRLIFETADEVRERGKSRSVIIEAHPRHCEVRLRGLRTGFVLSWGACYSLAVKQSLREAQKAKKAGAR